MIIAFLVGIIIFGIIVLALVVKIGPKFGLAKRPLNQEYFQEKWLELLSMVKTPEGMAMAIVNADKLLDEALKKKHFRGKTMGERLVSAQRSISDNDAVWYAHKLRNRLVHEPNVKLRKTEAQNALAGFKKGLQDLGAL